MMPNLLVGDHIWVQRHAYGIRIPGTLHWIYQSKDPQAGDVVVFTYPADEEIAFVKRVVGVPGDWVEIKEGQLYINHEKLETYSIHFKRAQKEDPCVAQLDEVSEQVLPSQFKPVPYRRKFRQYTYQMTKLKNGTSFMIQQDQNNQEENYQLHLKEGQYFMMGDNRDHSMDSRFWGPVPRSHIIGKATSIWLSLNQGSLHCKSPFGGQSEYFRWYRQGREIH